MVKAVKSRRVVRSKARPKRRVVRARVAGPPGRPAPGEPQPELVRRSGTTLVTDPDEKARVLAAMAAVAPVSSEPREATGSELRSIQVELRGERPRRRGR